MFEWKSSLLTDETLESPETHKFCGQESQPDKPDKGGKYTTQFDYLNGCRKFFCD